MRLVTKPRTSVTSSKIASILNRSLYGDVISQWKIDTKQVKPEFTSTSRQKMDMGNKLEPLIKELVESYFNVKLTVDKNRYMHDDYDFFRIEFDALDLKNKIIYEFKNTVMDEKALEENYYPQLQFAMFISGWDKARLCYLKDGWDLGYIDVDRDQNFIDNMVKAGVYYWGCLDGMVEPDPEVVNEIASNITFYQKIDEKKGVKQVAELTEEDIENLYEWGKIKKRIGELEVEEARYKGMFVDKWGSFKNEHISYSNSEFVREGGYDIVALMKDHPEIDFNKYKRAPTKYARQTLRFKAPAEEETVTVNKFADLV